MERDSHAERRLVVAELVVLCAVAQRGVLGEGGFHVLLHASGILEPR